MSANSLFRPLLLLALVAVGINAASNSSSISSGIAKVNVGIGCGSSTAYPVASTSTAQPVFSYTFENPLAEFISLHFIKFNLPTKDYVLLRATSADSKETRTMRYSGAEFHEDFFSSNLYAKSIVLELYTSGDTTPYDPSNCLGFVIDQYRFAAMPTDFYQEEVCGSDDTKEAACFRGSPLAYKACDTVIRLVIHKTEGSIFCTGWLVGCEGHVITNNHCISEQAHASNTEFEFGAQGSTCSQSCNVPFGCPGTVQARTSTLISTSSDLDYTLVKLDINWSNQYGYLQLRETGAVLNERIYIPQHPNGWGTRIAMKDGDNFGKVEALDMSGCADNQVAYSLDTAGGASGSPVIGWSDNAVVALHHCGGCPNTAINIYKIVNDLRQKGSLPKCAIYSPPTTAPTVAPTTPAPTTPTPPKTKKKTVLDGTLVATSSRVSVDYIDFELSEDADVELDILSMEASSNSNSYVDVNGDCNAGYIDSTIVLFTFPAGGGMSEKQALYLNDNAAKGYGMADGSISNSDSYILAPLTKGKYRLAVGTAPMSVSDAVKRYTALTSSPRVCDSKISNYGSYRLTITTTATVTASSPGTYIGSQCSSTNNVRPYSQCPYHSEADATRTTAIDGSIVRNSNSVSVDYVPFTLSAFGRVAIEVTSYESADGFTYYDIKGDCDSSYIDPVAYLFRRTSTLTNVLANSDLIAVSDEDDNYALRSNRRSISFRDPYLTLGLPAGNYMLVVGRYPLSLNDAVTKVSTTSVAKFTPESCGATVSRGNYLVTFATSKDITVTSPNTFQGRKCPNNVSTQICI